MTKSLYAIVALLLVLLFLTSCQSGAPQDIVDAAIEELKSDNHFCCDSPSFGCGPCRDFKVNRSYQDDLTSADKANGIDTRWCVVFDYLKHNGSAWTNQVALAIVTIPAADKSQYLVGLWPDSVGGGQICVKK